MSRYFLLAALIFFVAWVRDARGDAIVVTKAMKATTIVEVFLSDDSIRVDLEIGINDLSGFRNLMPDPIYERMGFEPQPFDRRLERFFASDWTITAEDGPPLRGVLANIEARYRVKRDEITGEPLPSTADEREPIVFVSLTYALTGRPQSLTIKPPTREETSAAAADVGFVLYHMGLPVTDFRYLGGPETVDLDWADPWYSSFRNRNLKRRFSSPISVYLYVENYEVRKEIIARPKDLQQWVDLGVEGTDTISSADQEELKDRVAEFFADRSPVTINNRTPEPVLDRIHFVRRTLRRTGVIDPPEDLAAISATLGIIYVYPIDSLPEVVTMAWELFSDKIQRIPSSATDEAGGLPYFLTPGDSILVWQNFLTNPTVPTLVAIATPSAGVPVPLASAVCGLVVIALLIWFVKKGLRRSLRTVLLIAALMAAAVLLRPVARVAVPISGSGGMSQEETEAVVGGLLTNVYRAFDYRDESNIYDTLERSATGDLLTKIYLETRRALELQNQGGARVKVKEVGVDSVLARPLEGKRGFVAQCAWTVAGSVGHWGHIHTRQNRYDAVFTIEAIDGVWKITELELLEEKRVL
jgi:hypothetical protein